MKSPVPANAVAQSRRSEELLRAIIQGTVAVTGTQFFRSLVLHLAQGLHVRWVFVAECLPNLRARSLAFWQDHDFGEDFEYALPGTPCMEVAHGRTCHVPERLAEIFPEDKGMIEMGTVSYLGVPLVSSEKRIIGHLVVFDDKPMPADALVLSVMETFAARAGAELERKQADEEARRLREELAARKLAEVEQQKQRISDQLQQTGHALAASEERFRDLFDEAPIAYVNEGLDSRFIKANRAAMRTLGITPEQVEGTYGRDFVPNTPDAQRRLKDAFESIGRGTDTSGVVLELRRRDNGKPLWIQWWSKPDPSGTYTRTMFVDITERVLMEQEKARLEAQNTYLQEEIRNEHNFGEIVGNSCAWLNVLRQVDQVAPADSTALIIGETGTGKELVARAVHDRSGRKARPLVKVNCGAISAGLVESELFGHVKGAFTGALANRDGRFKVADGGTIFLDEVGELPLETQVKLLRVLQEQEFEPIGSSKTVKVDVRIIAATNRDLGAAVADGKFRRDLYYRLNVFPIAVPPLRERASDVPLLVSFFLQRFAKKLGKPVKLVSEGTMRRLASYSWPGNIRELQNVIERAILLSPGDTLQLAADFCPLPTMTVPDARSLSTRPTAHKAAEIPSASAPTSAVSIGAMEEVERRHIESVLAQTNWMIEGERGAARILNLNPSTLRSRMKNLGIKRPDRIAQPRT
ncbi:MAG: Fis family transcriptional regulator [Verrucomicrobia bacterium]|nr:MAG: Fis family transcriptional regulator [Verrucomicrobiota bacterium]